MIHPPGWDSCLLRNQGYRGTITIEQILSKTPYQKIGGLWYQTKNVAIGYWPKELVPSLEIEAGDVGWGGIAMAQEKENAPPLGSGQYPDGTSLESQGDTKEVFVGSVSRSSEVFSREKFRRLGEGVVSRSTHLVFMEDDEELGLLLGFAAPISSTAMSTAREEDLELETQLQSLNNLLSKPFSLKKAILSIALTFISSLPSITLDSRITKSSCGQLHFQLR
ncbi:hypothetical protein L3X38_043354 [Prunus dulcis]|uniref:Neprosin PEP catalytic domain-containing protein n=1 Tax=Prunus dulcis TaxID=3755 RepID=A0AAD4UWZ4_PRUDU|nr:hypothetical protein L3X38_043354 [Prunus dulcis]